MAFSLGNTTLIYFPNLIFLPLAAKQFWLFLFGRMVMVLLGMGIVYWLLLAFRWNCKHISFTFLQLLNHRCDPYGNFQNNQSIPFINADFTAKGREQENRIPPKLEQFATWCTLSNQTKIVLCEGQILKSNFKILNCQKRRQL